MSAPQYLFLIINSFTASDPSCLPAKIMTHLGSNLLDTQASHISRLIGINEDFLALSLFLLLLQQ
jgi:hypothetical protein